MTTTEEATTQLRFRVKEPGTETLVLQQAWLILSRDGGIVCSAEIEWRDVPIANDI
jgi:hypothetical protein